MPEAFRGESYRRVPEMRHSSSGFESWQGRGREVVMKQKKGNRGIFAAAGIAAAICAVLVTVLIVTGRGTDQKLSDLLALGEKYLSELDYEQAIAAYRQAIEIDPRCEDAYLALADIYVAMEDYEAAREVLEEGVSRTGAEALSAQLAQVQESYGAQWQEGKPVEGAEASAGSADADTSLENGADEDGIIYYEDGTYGKTEYDTDGNPVRENIYYEDGTLYRYLIYTYENGVVKVTFYNWDGTLDYWEIREQAADTGWGKITRYDENGELEQVSEYDENGILRREIWYYSNGDIYENEYDGEGNPVKSVSYRDGGVMTGSQEYDSRGNKLNEYMYDNNGNRWGYEYEYDEEDRRIRETTINSDGSIEKIYIHEFDEQGNRVRETTCNGDGSVKEYTIVEYEEGSRDSERAVKSTVYHADGTMDCYIIWQYNENGQVVDGTYYNPDGTLMELPRR